MSEGKDCLTVLDFIGQANRRYHFDDKFAALLSSSEKNISNEIRRGFTSLPKGCYIQLERKAEKYILDNIRASYGTAAGLISRIETFEEDSGRPLSLGAFLEYHHLSVQDIYKFKSFSRLCVMAGIRDDFDEPLEDVLTKAFGRLAYIDSRRWISFLLHILTASEEDLGEYGTPVDLAENSIDSVFTEREIRMLQMFQYTVWAKSYKDCGFSNLLDGIREIRKNRVLCGEMIELLRYRYNDIDVLDAPVDLGFDCPLDLHCNYTRDQILVAMDFMKPGTVREGVKYLPDKKMDVFFITLNKSDKDYSPTTMYKDYSINETLFHWQSQSTTSETSETGKRYIHHSEQGSRIAVFVREFKKDPLNGKASPYTFLGTAEYVTHEGSRPMSITWKLHAPIPAKYLPRTNRLLVV